MSHSLSKVATGEFGSLSAAVNDMADLDALLSYLEMTIFTVFHQDDLVLTLD